jgi:hypothetical protein
MRLWWGMIRLVQSEKYAYVAVSIIYVLRLCCSCTLLFHFENVYVPILNNCGINKIIQIVCCWYPKNDQKSVTYTVLPLSENDVNFEVRKMTKFECFFCKKPGKSENIPLFCQKTPQKHQILL